MCSFSVHEFRERLRKEIVSKQFDVFHEYQENFRYLLVYVDFTSTVSTDDLVAVRRVVDDYVVPNMIDRDDSASWMVVVRSGLLSIKHFSGGWTQFKGEVFES